MIIAYIILAFIFGISIGSFLNVLVLRIDDLKSVWNSRSHCPKCKHTLAWYDLVPLFSYLILYGKCRYCKEKISIQYPIVELAIGIMFAIIYLNFGLTFQSFFYAIVFSILSVVFIYDLKTEEVPENFVWIALIATGLGAWYANGLGFWSMILGGLVGGGILAFLVIVSKEKWMGMGDIKIGIILGFLAGYPVAFFGTFLAFLLGSIVGLIFMAIRKKTMKDSLPFAPFLILAMFITILYGQYVVQWYLGIIRFQ